ncbi:MAG: hypothetical protein QW743_07815 [Candidatus Methanomethylicia archaeon]
MSNKGFSRIIELLFALIIISSASVIFPLISYRVYIDVEFMYSIAFNALSTVEENGYLSFMVYNGNWGELTNYIKNFIPANFKFRLIVYDESLNVLYSNGVNPSDFVHLISIPYILKFKGVTRIIVLEIWR